MPSTTRRLGVSATLVKIEFLASAAIAFGLVLTDVPGATPKNPASGLMARSRPLASGLIQAMSSPTVVTFQSFSPSGGISMAKFVLPQALGTQQPRKSFRLPDSPRPESACARPSSLRRAPWWKRCAERSTSCQQRVAAVTGTEDQISRASGKWTMYFSLLQGQERPFHRRQGLAYAVDAWHHALSSYLSP